MDIIKKYNHIINTKIQPLCFCVRCDWGLPPFNSFIGTFQWPLLSLVGWLGSLSQFPRRAGSKTSMLLLRALIEKYRPFWGGQYDRVMDYHAYPRICYMFFDMSQQSLVVFWGFLTIKSHQFILISISILISK